MDSAMYVALSAQVALERRLDTIAHNVANLGTVGYRADEVKFDTMLQKAGEDSLSFVSSGDTYISRRAGALTRTDNDLDVAVQGEGWFAIQTPQGVAYTRDGRMRMLETGELTTLNGYAILDVGRAPITLDPTAGAPNIARDGMITQNGQQLGAIGLFGIDPSAQLDRFENSGVLPAGPVAEILDFSTNGVVQGFVEQSNVNPVMEIARLISVTRAFEAASSAVATTDSTAQAAIRTLGENS
jgi:flagellar basal-body rod protein FlgF